MRILFIILFISTAVLANKPLYELGIGVVGFHSPHYPASEQIEFRHAFLPLVIYRGETIYADEEGIKSDIAESSWYNFDLSMTAAFPADSENNKARAGMDDLDWLAEFGPSFEIHLYKKEYERIDLRLQARAVLSTDFGSVDYQGYVLHPMLYYEKVDLLDKKLEFVLRAGAIWANEGVMDYFYEVGDKDVTPTRAKYNAREGYIEGHFDMGFIYQINKNLRSFLGFQKNFYNGAKNKDSPLHLRKEATSIGIGFTWIFFRSKARASASY